MFFNNHMPKNHRHLLNVFYCEDPCELNVPPKMNARSTWLFLDENYLTVLGMQRFGNKKPKVSFPSMMTEVLFNVNILRPV